MATDWSTVIGNYPQLTGPKITSTIMSFVYKTMLKRRDNIFNTITEFVFDLKDPHEKFLTLKEEISISTFKGEKKDKPKPMYKQVSNVYKEVEVDGKKTKEKIGTETTDKAKGKWITFSTETKWVITFMLLKYVKEIENFYNHCENKFPSDDELISKFEEFALSPGDDYETYISPFIIRVNDSFDVNSIIDTCYENADQDISEILNKQVFKNAEGESPTTKINIFVKYWINFMKYLSIQMATIFYYKRCKGDIDLLYGIIRQIEVSIPNAEFGQALFIRMEEYIQERKEMEKQKAATSKERQKNKAVEPSLDDLGDNDMDDLGDWNEQAGNSVDATSTETPDDEGDDTFDLGSELDAQEDDGVEDWI